MLCAVCGKLSPDLEGQVEGESIRFHSECALCYFCGGTAMQFSVLEDHTLLFVHERCMFTPDQASTLLRLQAEYARSQDH